MVLDQVQPADFIVHSARLFYKYLSPMHNLHADSRSRLPATSVFSNKKALTESYQSNAANKSLRTQEL
ncbi:hypothetical protein EMIT0P100_10857 [Pseudomonas sp. IT-P100]